MFRCGLMAIAAARVLAQPTASCATNGLPCAPPKWTPVWNLTLSTICQPSAEGYFVMLAEQPWGLGASSVLPSVLSRVWRLWGSKSHTFRESVNVTLATHHPSYQYPSIGASREASGMRTAPTRRISRPSRARGAAASSPTTVLPSASSVRVNGCGLSGRRSAASTAVLRVVFPLCVVRMRTSVAHVAPVRRACVRNRVDFTRN